MTLLSVIAAICFVESGNTPWAINVHDGGTPSYGECQVKLDTARRHGYRGPVSGLLTRRVNRAVALQILSDHYEKYGSFRESIEAYNRGRASSAPLRSRYVRRVLMLAVAYE